MIPSQASPAITLFTAVKALVRYQDRILVLRESKTYTDGTQAGRYDVPGGRITPGEAWDDALRREVLEECGLSVIIGAPFHISEVRIDKGDTQWQIIRVFLMCDASHMDVVLGEDHDHFQWATLDEIAQLPMISNLTDTFAAYRQLRDKK